MTHEIRKVAKVTLLKSRGFGPTGKESWWWKESVHSTFRIKRGCFKYES